MNAKCLILCWLSWLVLGCGRESQEPVSTAEQPTPQETAISTPALNTSDNLWLVAGNPDWTLAEQPALYTPDDLFQYVNGAAPKYLSYGFQQLTHFRYSYKKDELSCITVDVYEMGNPLGAYGIYSTARSRDIERRNWGTEGFRSGEVAMAWKQHVYVQAMADDDRPVLIEMLEKIMVKVFSVIPGEDVIPELLDVFPRENLIPYTDRYVGKDLLGHAFLPGGFLVNYNLDGQEVLAFISDLGMPEASQAALASLMDFEQQHGKILESGPESLWVEDSGLGLGGVRRTAGYLTGVFGVTSQDQATPLLEKIAATLGKTRK
ncbi:MAG TPA: hypothetical protein PLG59_00395 [bacterium]|nr:hypothetical protein [bacterium]HQP97238.1 hypothetical protein [bacterium]